MQGIDFNPLLVSAATEVLESMCFISVVESSDESVTEDDTWIAARLQFQGWLSGDFGLRTPLATARIIASNFLGEDEADLNTLQVIEVLCELSNMICGSFLNRLEGKGAYDLSHPVRDLMLAQPPAVAACQALQLNEGALCVWLSMEPTS
jgi:CheY-specific phosphatase CheX